MEQKIFISILLVILLATFSAGCTSNSSGGSNDNVQQVQRTPEENLPNTKVIKVSIYDIVQIKDKYYYKKYINGYYDFVKVEPSYISPDSIKVKHTKVAIKVNKILTWKKETIVEIELTKDEYNKLFEDYKKNGEAYVIITLKKSSW